MQTEYPQAKTVDITLLLEGTYPFVTGGVSSWVHQILCAFPHYRFAIIFLGSRPEDYGDLRYSLPENLVHLETHYLFTDDALPPLKNVHCSPDSISDLNNLHKKFHGMKKDRKNINCLMGELSRQLFSKEALSYEHFLYSPQAWQYITEQYTTKCPDICFIDYFWSVRNMHAPIWQLINIANQAPESKIFHSASTGYAGFLGALLRGQRQCPFIVTEHGIYTKERRIDLLQSQWLAFNHLDQLRKIKTTRYLADLWISFFEVLAQLCYDAADPVVSLFSTYQQRQISDGARKDRTCIIPNGIDVSQFKQITKEAPNQKKPVLGLIGRVIQIKDIKTFIRSMAIVVQHIPQAQGWIVGPMDDDPTYVKECKDLVTMLRLDKKVLFLGQQNIHEVIPKMDLVILSSISEGLPFVVLEAFATGVPVVSTDVGACRELIYGKTDSDKALGKSGEVVAIANPKALATAATDLLLNSERWLQAKMAAVQRVALFYDLPVLVKEYSAIYEEALQ